MVHKIEYDMTKFMRKSGSNAVHGKMLNLSLRLILILQQVSQTAEQ